LSKELITSTYRKFALPKNYNGWVEFSQGEFRVTIEKFVDVNELHIEIKTEKNGVGKH